MVKNTLQNTLESLATKHIPNGVHKYLYVDSRKAWIKLMIQLIEAGTIEIKLPVLKKCVTNWEVLLIRKISIQN